MDGNRDSAAHKRGTQMEEPSTVGSVTLRKRPEPSARSEQPSFGDPPRSGPGWSSSTARPERVQRSCDSDDGLEPSLVLRGGEDTI
jgi:hypothetical protein